MLLYLTFLFYFTAWYRNRANRIDSVLLIPARNVGAAVVRDVMLVAPRVSA